MNTKRILAVPSYPKHELWKTTEYVLSSIGWSWNVSEGSKL